MKIKKNKIIEKTIYLISFFSCFGSSIGIEIGGFILSPYRGLIILIVLLIIFIHKPKVNNKINFFYKNRFIVYFLVLWFSFSLISLIWVQSISYWIKAFFFLLVGILNILILLKYINNIKQIKNIFYVMSMGGILHNIIGWNEVIFKNYYFLNDYQKLKIYKYFDLPISTFANTNNLAFFLFFNIIAALIVFGNTDKYLVKVVEILNIVFSLGLIYYTNSRGIIFSLIIFLLVLMLIKFRANKKRKILILNVLIFLIFILLNKEIVLNFLEKHVKFSLSKRGGSDYIRQNLIKNGFYFLGETLGFGVGLGNSKYWLENFSKYSTQGILVLHNWWLELLVENGLLIFIFYIGAYIKIIKDCYKKLRKSKDEKEKKMLRIVFSFLISLVIALMVSSSNFSAEWFWVLTSVLIVYQKFVNKKEV